MIDLLEIRRQSYSFEGSKICNWKSPNCIFIQENLDDFLISDLESYFGILKTWNILYWIYSNSIKLKRTKKKSTHEETNTLQQEKLVEQNSENKALFNTKHKNWSPTKVNLNL